MRNKFLLLLIICCCSAMNVSAQDSAQESVFGKWVTIDDETGEKRSVVEIYQQGDELFGKIVHLFNPSGPNPVCEKCSDDRKDQPVMNMDIIRNMKVKDDGTTWGNGNILDPEKGKEYGCTLWVEDGKLQVKGWVAFFSRTQTWIKE